MQINKKRSTKKILVLSAGALVVVAIAAGLGFFLQSSGETRSNQPVRPVNTVDYSGPTKEEQNAGNEQKKANKITDENITDASDINSANLVISDANQYENQVEVRAYVSNLIEDGTCTVTFTKPGATAVTTTSTAIKDARATQCGALDTKLSRFPSGGTWNAKISFVSASDIKGSVTTTIEVKK